MCILEPPTPITATPNALSDPSSVHPEHFESLLMCATIISTMGNIHPMSDEAADSTSSDDCSYAATRAVRQVCPLSTFILGGPMPPSPGLIPLCWEDLIDWTNDATEITDKVYQRSRDGDVFSTLLPDAGLGLLMNKTRGIRFVPYVSVNETEANLRKLTSQSYMERAQFYQESVVIAVQSKEDQAALCLISLFQFCRYFTLIRRLADSQTLVLEYQPTVGRSAVGQPLGLGASSNDDHVLGPNIENDSLLASNPSIQESSPSQDGELQDCVICLEKTEDSVLFCCSQAICADCEKRWVRKRLRCPFCRQSFASVKEAVQTQWQLSSAIPVEQVVQDVQCLGEKVRVFWEGLGIHQRSDAERVELASVLETNYVDRPKTLVESATEELDGFVLVHDLSEFRVDFDSREPIKQSSSL